MVQVPVARIVTVVPETEHTVGVAFELKLTARVEEADAFTVNGADPKTLSESGLNVMVWLAAVMVKFWLTGAAAE